MSNLPNEETDRSILYQLTQIRTGTGDYSKGFFSEYKDEDLYKFIKAYGDTRELEGRIDEEEQTFAFALDQDRSDDYKAGFMASQRQWIASRGLRITELNALKEKTHE